MKPINKPNQPNSDSSSRGPQFGTRIMFVAVTLVSIVFAVLNLVGPVAAFSLALFMLAVLAHVAGNSMGTRLRDVDGQQAALHQPAETSAASKHVDRAPNTRLHSKAPLGWPVVVVTILGCILGAAIGNYLFHWLYANVATPTRTAIGVTGMAAIGGFVAFGMWSFFQVAMSAFRQAAKRS